MGETPPKIEIPREVQRFIIALTLVVGFLVVFAIVFLTTKDVETAKTVLTFLAGTITSVTAYFFGAKSAEAQIEKLK
jgi:type IV secretory pathway VirB3-like protein